MTVPNYPDGSVCWIDLGTPDTDNAQMFYADLFGWTFTEPDPTGYRLASLGGLLVAALGPAEDPGPPYWTINVTVADIHGATARLADAGADILWPAARFSDSGSD